MSLTLNLRQDFTQPQTQVYAIDSAMFEAVEKSLVKGGDLEAQVTAHKAETGIVVDFCIAGKVKVECDRCLDDMEMEVSTSNRLTLVSSDHYEDNCDIVYIDESQTGLDLWPMIYDFIVLSLPLTHTHPPGQCNSAMTEQLNRYMVDSKEE